MAEERQHRIRLKLPGGAEFEAEGSPEFVHRERQDFLKNIQGSLEAAAQDAPSAGHGGPQIAWDSITEVKGRNIQLRGKLAGGKSEKDACLVLLAASQKLLGQPKPTATQLAKWLRVSGYPILRMDRALHDAVSQGEILSSGSRRARRYELTAPGRLKAFILANQLTGTITGRA
ncbi:MAG: hypothetical protein HY077_03015 [Elusimicrobia bacterium]|nr:hypothetical protein [Elusimicrobiota bacterium]